MNNLEFINQATTLLTQDYNLRRTAEYSSWLQQHKNAWMQPHTIIPFPPFVISASTAPFKPVVSAPSEADIVSKALELYNQSNQGATNSSSPVAPPSEEILYSPPIFKEHIVEPIVVEPIADTIVEPIVIESIVEEPVSETIVEPEQFAEEPVEKLIEPISTLYADEVYKIFQTTQTSTEHVTSSNTPDTTIVDIGTALSVVPQPAEELAKIAIKEKSKPSILERLQNMTGKLSGSN